MSRYSSTTISGILAFAVYFILVGLLIFYFNTRNEDKSRHFVKKDEHRIQVSLSSPKKVTAPKKKTKKKTKVKPKTKPKTKPKQKKIIKEKVIKKKTVKKRDLNVSKSKRQTRDLFKNVKTSKKKLKIQVSDRPIKTKPKKDIIKVSSMSASERINASLQSRKASDSGVENAYFAKVQRMLEDWPAQSDYAGEKAKVILYIKPSGFFKFRVVSQSSIPAFNRGLEEFLEQLQITGFGPHNAGRTYKFEAEFIAKD
jgi:protein TonB